MVLRAADGESLGAVGKPAKAAPRLTKAVARGRCEAPRSEEALLAESRRTTAYDQKRFGIRMAAYVPMTVTDRAYTSPIWYSP